MIPVPQRHAMIAVLLCVGILGCGEKGSDSVCIGRIDFLPTGARIELNRKCNVDRVAVFDSGGAQLRSMNVAAKQQTRFTIPFQWAEHASYRLEVFLSGGCVLSRTAAAPAKAKYLAELDMKLPYGAVMPASASSLVGWGASVDGGVEVESFLDAPIAFEIQLRFPQTISFDAPEGEWRLSRENGQIITITTGAVNTAFERWQRLFRMRLPEGRAGAYEVAAQGRFTAHDGATWSVERKTVLHAIDPSEAKSLLKIVSIDMPTDAQGRCDPARRPNHIVLPNEAARWIRRALRIGTDYIDAHEPVAFQTIRVKSASKEGMTLLFSADIVDRKTGRSIPAFAPSPHISPGGVPRTLATVFLPPDAVSDITFPIYINPADLLPGEYVRKIEARLLGTDTIVLQTSAPLFVIRRNVVAIGATLAASLVSLGAFVFLVAAHRRVFASFNIRALILIALFATTTFVAVGLPLTIVTNVVSALLGPFAFVITGIFSEVVYFLLLTALVVLIPRVGTVALATLVRYLLRGVMMGGFSPMDILYVGAAILLKELAFFAAGLTRNNGLLMSGYPEARRWIVMKVGLLSGACEGLSLFIALCLMACLYRLYFAYWYIGALVLLNGFVYTFIGVAFGLRLGHNLRKITD